MRLMPNPILCSIPPIASHQNRWDRSASSDVACLQPEPTTVCGVRLRASERRLTSVVCSMKSLVKFPVASRLRQGIRQPGMSSTASSRAKLVSIAAAVSGDMTAPKSPVHCVGLFDVRLRVKRARPPRRPRHGHLSEGRPHARHLRGGCGRRPQEPPQSPRGDA